MAAVAACPTVRDLEEFLLGRLPDRFLHRLEEHLGGCPRCRSLLPTLKAEDTLVEALRKQATSVEEQPEKDLVEDLVRRLQALPAPTLVLPGKAAAADVVPRAESPPTTQELVMITF